MKKVVSPHDCLDLSRLGVFIIWDFSSPTWILPPNFSAVLGTLCLASHTREHKDKWPWREAPFSHISILSAATSLCSSEMGRLFGEREQKKIPKVGLPLSFLSKGRKMELYREENSTTKRNVFAELWSLQGMNVCRAEDSEEKIREVFTLLACQREVKVLKGEYIWVQMQN